MNPKRVAMITGVTGQDGSYLAELLLLKGYSVYGLMRRSSTDTTGRLEVAKSSPDFHLVECDIVDATGVYRLVQQIKPDELYNLAAQSHVQTSFTQPVATFDVNAVGVLNLLEAIRLVSPTTRFWQASTSELFGNSGGTVQNEESAMSPESPYAVAKMAAYQLVKLYRRAYGIFSCQAIAFNHESPRRGLNFVTRKITDYVSRLWVYGDRVGKLQLGNIEARRDWGHAKDVMRGAWMMMQAARPDDFVLATGKTRSVKEFLTEAFSHIGKSPVDYVVYDTPDCTRPSDVHLLCGDSSKALSVLGWSPQIGFHEMVAEMVKSDFDRVTRESKISIGGVK